MTPSGPTRILLIDDEPIVRSIIRTVLQRQGYEVLPAGTGAEALDIARREGSAIGVVLLDFMMPGTSGEELLRALERLLPDAPVIVMSGYGRQEVMRDVDVPPAAFIQKPFESRDLVETIRRVLAP